MNVLSREDFERLKNSGMLYVVAPECDGTYEGYLKGQGMEPLKSMKIRIKDPEHNKRVQETLFAKGCKWAGGSSYVQQFDAKALYIYEADEYSDYPFILWSSADDCPEDVDNPTNFANTNLPEYHLNSDGEFVEGPEWVQSTLKELLQKKIDSMHPQPSRPAPPMPAVKPPLGLRPRKFAVQERMIEILEAVDRYVRELKEVPDEWACELLQLNRDMTYILKHENND